MTFLLHLSSKRDDYMLVKVFLLMFFCVSAHAQGVLGKWRTIDDQTGKPISIVEIFEHRGKIFGRVVDILDPKARHKVCTNCEGEDKGKPIIGLTIIKGLTRNGQRYTGEILDPQHGNIYSCNISLENRDRLKVRGFLGFSLLGRTQYWHRVN